MERLIERSREAEHAVVGSIYGVIRNPRTPDAAYRAAAAIVTADDFFDQPSRALWETYGDCASAGLPFESPAISPRLAERMGTSLHTAQIRLNALTDLMYLNCQTERFALEVRRYSQLRRLISRVSDCQQEAGRDDVTVDGLLSVVQEAAAEGIRINAEAAPSLLNSSDLVRLVIDEAGKTDDRIATQWSAIKRNGGLLPGELVVIVARPKVGKSALLQNLFADCLTEATRTLELRSGLYFSLEMPEKQWGERWIQIVCAQSRAWVSANFRRGSAVDDVVLKRLAAYKRLEVTRPTRPNVSAIEVLAMEHRALHGRLDIVGIDHFDFMELSGDTKHSLADRIRTTYNDLKLLAGRLGCAMVVLHQGSREGGDGTSAPTATAARGSAGPEESADLMLGVWRPGMESEDVASQREMNVRTLVARRSPPFTTRLTFDPETLRITDESEG